MSYQTVYREVHQPTSVTHCAEAYFTHAADKQRGSVAPNLVLVRGTRLEVYSLNYGTTPAAAAAAAVGRVQHAVFSAPPAAVSQCRLELVGSWQCWGLIEDLAVLRGRGSSGQRDSLVLAVRDAKVAVIEWDDDLHCLRNGSLHSYEGDPSLRDGCPCGSSSNILSVPPALAADPNGRCAAVLVYGLHLAILPAMEVDYLEQLVQQDGNTAKGSTDSASVGNSYLVHLAKVLPPKSSARNNMSDTCALTDASVRGMTFLHGYTEPVLLLLYEQTQTWGGRLRDAKDTCALAAMSINIKTKKHPVIWRVEKLPSDCSSVMAVPRGGVLVLSQNLLLYYSQSGSCVMAINSFAFAGEVPPKLDPPAAPTFPPFPQRTQAEIAAAAQAAADKAAIAAVAHAKQWAVNVHPETVAAAAKGAPKAPGMELEADRASGCWLAGNVALLSLKTGQLLLVALKFEGAAASKIQVLVAGSAPVASCAATLTSNLLFLGSTVGDSLLIRYTQDTPLLGSSSLGTAAGVAAADRGGSSAGGAENPAKRRRLASLASWDMGGGLEGQGGEGFEGFSLEEEGELHRCAVGRAHSSVTPVLLGDGLKQNFKVLDSLMCLGPMRSSVIADLHLRESDVHASLSNSATGPHKPSPCLIAAVGSDKTGALAIMRRGMVADVITAVPQLRAHGAWTLHYRPEVADEPQPTAGTADQHHAFLLLSVGGESTMVLDAGGAELAELTEGVGFVRNAPTLAVGEFFGTTAAVQVTHSTVRLVRGSSQLLQELSLSHILTAAGHTYAQAVTAAIAAAELAAENASSNDAAGLPVLPVCIKYAQIRDPYVVLLLSDATALVLQGDEKQQQLQLLTAALPVLAEAGWQESDTAAVTAVCLYTDTTGWLASAAGITIDGASDAADIAADNVAAADLEGQNVADAAQQQAAAAEAEDADMADAAASAPAAGEEPSAELQPGSDAAAGAQTAPLDDKDMTDADSTAAAKAETAADNALESKIEQPTATKQAAAAGVAIDAATELGTDEPAAAVPGDVAPAALAAAAVDESKPAIETRPERKARFVVPGLDPADGAMGGVEGLDAGVAAAEAAGDVQEAATAAEAADHDGAAAAGGAAEVTDASVVAAAAAAATAAAAAVPDGNDAIQDVAVEQAVPLEAAADADASVTNQRQQQQCRQLARPMTFCAVMRSGGGLQLYALPSMTCVFEDAEAVLGHQTLSLLRPVSQYNEMVEDEDLRPSPVTELMMECFAGSSGAALNVPAAVAPLLVMLMQDGTCLAYKAFKPQNPNSPFGFRRLPLDQGLLAHPSPAPKAADEDDAGAAEAPPPAIGMPLPSAAPCRLVRFDQLATPRLEPPIGPGLKAWGFGGEGGRGSQAGGGSVTLPQLRYSGIFVCGPHPVWLIASRGGLVAHPMEADVGHVDGFCAFHNQNCPYGYIAASLEGEMKICTLPLQMRLDQPWLSCKLPLRATPHSIASYPELHLLAVTTSRLSAPPRPFLPAEPGGDAVAAAAYATAEAATKAAQVEELHELQLLAPPGYLPMSTYTEVFQAIKAAADAAGPAAGGTGSSLLTTPSFGAAGAAGSSARAAAAVAAAAGWAGLPMWRYSLLPGEQAMTVKHVALCEGGDEKANPVPYIAVGCASTYGEDYPTLGRVLLFEVVRDKVFKLQGGSAVKVFGRLELQREYPGPVTALESLRGYLITAVGNRLEMHYKQGNALVKVNFLDGLQPASGISLVKDYILLGRSGQSCGFFRYNSSLDQHTRERQQKLEEMSVDTERLDAWAVEFMPNEKKLNFVMADGGGNLTVLVYDKQDPESWKGKKLLRKGAAHVGAWMSQFQRLKLKVPGDASNRQGLLACTAHGGLLFLNPLWDGPLYTRLNNLQAELVYAVPHTAGLNPKAFQGRYTRAGPTYGAGFNVMKPLKPEENTMLQGDLLFSYAGVDLRVQAVIAEAIGARPDEVLADLRQLSIATDIL